MVRAVTVYSIETNAAIKAKKKKSASSRVGGTLVISTSALPWNNRLSSDRCGKHVSHPDAAVTQDGRVRSAVGVDVGLRVVNGTFHLPGQEAIKAVRKKKKDMKGFVLFFFLTVIEENFDCVPIKRVRDWNSHSNLQPESSLTSSAA